MQNAGLDEAQDGIKMAWKNINNITSDMQMTPPLRQSTWQLPSYCNSVILVKLSNQRFLALSFFLGLFASVLWDIQVTPFC